MLFAHSTSSQSPDWSTTLEKSTYLPLTLPTTSKAASKSSRSYSARAPLNSLCTVLETLKISGCTSNLGATAYGCTCRGIRTIGSISYLSIKTGERISVNCGRTPAHHAFVGSSMVHKNRFPKACSTTVSTLSSGGTNTTVVSNPKKSLESRTLSLNPARLLPRRYRMENLFPSES